MACLIHNSSLKTWLFSLKFIFKIDLRICAAEVIKEIVSIHDWKWRYLSHRYLRKEIIWMVQLGICEDLIGTVGNRRGFDLYSWESERIWFVQFGIGEDLSSFDFIELLMKWMNNWVIDWFIDWFSLIDWLVPVQEVFWMVLHHPVIPPCRYFVSNTWKQMSWKLSNKEFWFPSIKLQIVSIGPIKLWNSKTTYKINRTPIVVFLFHSFLGPTVPLH